ncbi:MAG: hypothetical protein WDZ28_03000 [Simkaniaceae bacterium]
MFRRIILPVFAVIGFLLGGFLVFISVRKLPPPKIPFNPPQSPYMAYVAGAGIVEASSLNIVIGTPFSEVVEEVFVIGHGG